MGRQIIFVAPEGAPDLFKRVVAALGEEIIPRFKDMDLLPAGHPITDWTLDGEVQALLSLADTEGFETFDLVGYSGGGAVSLAFVASHPARIRSLTLIEPPWIGNDIWGEEERRFVSSPRPYPGKRFPASPDRGLPQTTPFRSTATGGGGFCNRAFKNLV
jgi:pimeloyl-ACP methyl ester carboxylesterase